MSEVPDIVDVTGAFGLADRSVINWNGVNYVPQRASWRVRLHNWRVRTVDAWRTRRGDFQDAAA